MVRTIMKPNAAASTTIATRKIVLNFTLMKKHMNMLHEGGLVDKKQDGSRCLYSMPDDTLCRLCLIAAEKIRAKADRLRRLV